MSAFSEKKYSCKWFRYLIPVVVERLGTAQYSVVWLNKLILVFSRHAVVHSIDNPHRVANVFNLWIQLPDHFFSSRSYYSISPQWSLIFNVLTEVAKVNNPRIQIPDNFFQVNYRPGYQLTTN